MNVTPTTFYRVCNSNGQGLWYNPAGEFKGLIHNEFNFCQHNQLRMDYDPILVGWLSATRTISDLYNWFPLSDIIQLQNFGWYVYEYEVSEFKFYDKFKHYIINQSSSIQKTQIKY